MTIRRGPVLSVVVAVSLFIALISGCNRGNMQDSPKPAARVTLAYATPPYTALADIAQAKGYFAQEGLEVTPLFHSTGKAALDELLDGKVDFATVAETPVMFAIMKGAKISIIATIQASTRVNAVCARKDSGINGPHDLKGKRIGAPLGTAMEFFMDTFLVSHGVDRKKMKVVNLRPEEMVPALANGDVDAISTFPPFLGEVQTKLGDAVTTFYEEDIYRQMFNVVAKQEYIQHHPETVRRLLLALVKAEELARRDPEEAQKTVADFRRTERALISAIWPGNVFEVALDQRLLLSLEDESRWAIKNKLAKGAYVPNYLDNVYLDGLGSVRPKSVRIVR